MMTATSHSAINFSTDMHANTSWDPSVPVPFPSPIAIPDTDILMAELSMITSAINTPIATPDNAPSPVSDHEFGLFRTGPSVGSKRKMLPDLPLHKRNKVAKIEHTFEPVTPSSRTKSAPSAVPKIHVAPMSPACQSLCTEEPDELLSMPPTPVPADFSVLPYYSKEQSAKRRALRKAALKRNRIRKEEGRTSVKTEPTVRPESDHSTGEPIDKKAARAIRNREAAMKSRVEAKQKMRKLQDENDSLAVKVKTLSEENEALTSQLRSLLQHTMDVPVSDGQDVKEVFNMFAPVPTRA